MNEKEGFSLFSFCLFLLYVEIELSNFSHTISGKERGGLVESMDTDNQRDASIVEGRHSILRG